MEHCAGGELRPDAFSKAGKLEQGQAWRTNVTSEMAGVEGEAGQRNKRPKAADVGEIVEEHSTVGTSSKTS